MLRDTQFLEHVGEDISASLFPDETMSRLVRIILDFFNREHASPDTLIGHVLSTDRSSQVLTEDQYKACSHLADELMTYQLQNRGFLIEKFRDFLRLQKYRVELPKLHAILESGDFSEADKVLNDILTYKSKSSVKMGTEYVPENVSARTSRRAAEDGKRLWSHIPELDKITPGLLPGEMGVIQSRMSSDGKTAFLTHLARAAAFQGETVMLFTVGDMTEAQYIDRLDMCFAGLGREELTDDAKIVTAISRMLKFRGRIHVKEFAARKTSIAMLRDYCRRYESTTSSRPTVVILDYLACCGPDDKLQFRGDHNAASIDVIHAAKEWIKDEQIILWTAAQSGRDAAKVAHAEQHHIAGSIELIRTADDVYSISRTDGNQHETVIKITKTRNSAGIGQSVTIPTNFSKMQFYDGSRRRENV